MPQPILYSFRRCPYAMRARLALRYADIRVELREVELKNKPQTMLEASPKGTVPVLIAYSGSIIDESLDIMRWALTQNDPGNWLDISVSSETNELIHQNDHDFKPWLDKYKYADRHPEHGADYFRQQCEPHLQMLEKNLESHQFLLSNQLSLADIAVFPFIRQFAAVDQQWFESSPYTRLRQWLNSHLCSGLFKSVMTKYSPWSIEKNNGVIF